MSGWLWTCLAAIFAMVVIGGVTRLTESGLSITEWRPLVGTLPPLSGDDWQRLYDLYRQTPEFRTKNFGMSLAEFKTIFWWEYVHRLWGRLIGVAFFVPFAVFWLRGWFERPFALRLLLVFCLGGLQGAIGWWMVQSGLVDRPEVSAYRLALHLGLAFLIFALILWTMLDLFSTAPTAVAPGAGRGRRRAWIVLAIVSMTVLAGAFVAGNDAGLVYNSFPLMDGHLIPPDYVRHDIRPVWRNLFESHAAVQLHHRILALVSLAAVVLLRFSLRKHPTAARPAALLCLAAVMQAVIGVATLLLAVPVALGALHQAGALVVFMLAVWTTHAADPPPPRYWLRAPD